MNSNNDIELPLLSRKDSSKRISKPDSDKSGLPKSNTNEKPKLASHFVDYVNISNPQTEMYSYKSNFIQWLTFSDMLPHVKRMNQTGGKFGFEQIPNPEPKFRIGPKLLELDKHWQDELKSGKPSFSRALYHTFLKEAIQTVILVFIDNTTKMYCSIYMGRIIGIITSSDLGEAIESEELISSTGTLSILVIISVFARCWTYFIAAITIGKARLTITAMLYKKLNSISLTSLHEIKIGKVINLVGNDINDLQTIFQLPTTIITPFLIVLAVNMMWGYFESSCLVGLFTLIFLMISQVYLSKLTEKPRGENKGMTDERVKLTHEAIEGIRLIKMYTWENLFQPRIDELRRSELTTFMKLARIDAFGSNLSKLAVYINILAICILYTASGGDLSPEKVYASMMILMYLSSCLSNSQQGMMGLVNYRMITSRVQEVLLIQDVLSVEETLGHKKQEKSATKDPIIYKDFTGYWTKTSDVPCLSSLNLSFPHCSITAIIGKIGSGKTSLLLSFLRELPRTTGLLEYSGTIAYVEQDPIIFSGTFRENILFGRELDESLYTQVLTKCRLETDLKSFIHGDLTRIGERGVNLSGGQKARISLARALYSQSDIFLLDDPFSALDSKVAREIFDKVLKEDLAKKKTVILVTHHLHFAKESDHVILLNKGQVEAEGSFSELEKLNISLLNVFKIGNNKKTSDASLKNGVDSHIKTDENKLISCSQEEAIKEKSVEVTWSTYKNYLQVHGSWSIFLSLILLFLTSHGLVIFYTRFIGFWAIQQTYNAKDKEHPNQSFDHSIYVFVSVSILLLMIIVGYIKTLKLNKFLLMTNTEIHTRMINALLQSKTLFFDQNPVGRILNRFSNDIGIMDKTNPRQTFDFLDNIMSYITLLITVCVINPIVIIPSVLVIYGLYHARRFFEKPMSQVKELELMSKGPMISAVPATLQGLIIIRAYNQGGRFIQEFMDMVHNNIKAYVFQEKVIRIFGNVLDAPVQVLTLSGIWIFVVLISSYKIDSSLLGLCLMYLLKIGDQGSVLIRQSVYVDINMQSAQRILDYCNSESEAPQHIPEQDQKLKIGNKRSAWPASGEIIFNNVFLRYRSDLGLALKGLSFHIPGGLKVACVGRTGAGKSSIIQALFRMVEIEKDTVYQGSCIKIDGVDITSIGLQLLRSRLSIIPQIPVVFADTIKRNLDPLERLSDSELWGILDQVGLKEYVMSLPNQLETDITVSANTFSIGQKQLVCLARAIINRNKVIILDEATANVDVETDSFIQRTIMERFKDCTVLTIAHRLVTIANYDRVIVIDNGRAAEFDTPYALLVEKIGDEKINRKDSIFADMVKSTGENMANKIFEIARHHFYSMDLIKRRSVN